MGFCHSRCWRLQPGHQCHKPRHAPPDGADGAQPLLWGLHLRENTSPSPVSGEEEPIDYAFSSATVLPDGGRVYRDEVAIGLYDTMMTLKNKEYHTMTISMSS